MSRTEVAVPDGTPTKTCTPGCTASRGRSVVSTRPGGQPVVRSWTWPGWSSRSRTWTAPSGSSSTSASWSPTARRTSPPARHVAQGPCLVIRRGPRSRYVRHAMLAASRSDLDRLARSTGGTVEDHRGGHAVRLVDPSGYEVRVVAGVPELRRWPSAPADAELRDDDRAAQRAAATARVAAQVQRLGHVALETTRFSAALDWYLETLGLIVSDFLFLDDLRDHGPTMAFMRCDQGGTPTDHHTLAMFLGPRTGYAPRRTR